MLINLLINGGMLCVTLQGYILIPSAYVRLLGIMLLSLGKVLTNARRGQ